ncbi:hypothetical protein BB559_006055, partial [Furculomyces boomerangus]
MFEPILKLLKKTGVSFWIVVALPLGIIFGQFLPKFTEQVIQYFGPVFISMVKCLVVPLIFSTLYVGIVGHGNDLKAVGRLAVKSILYFEFVTTLALIFGLIMANIVKPGK